MQLPLSEGRLAEWVDREGCGDVLTTCRLIVELDECVERKGRCG